MKRVVPLVAVVLAAGVLVACGGDGAGGGGASGLSSSGGQSGRAGSGRSAPDDPVVVYANPAYVRALDNSFNPEIIQVRAGTEVVWTNQGRTDHDVLHIGGVDWGVEVDGFEPGAVYKHTFGQTGVYRYYCSIHGTKRAGMIGTVVVTN
jgi:plastocyanin